MRRVLVLMSTYNGGKFVIEQLESIFSQVEVEVHCLVRDDGSSDDTIEILEALQKKHLNLNIIRGENVGYKKSFMELVYSAGQYDYYAFSDQDDFWLPEKLSNAIKKLEAHDAEDYLLYHSNCTVVDSTLNPIRMLNVGTERVNKTKKQALLEGFAYGCTIVFNRKVRDLIQSYKIKYEYAHDFWIPLIVKLVGQVIYDENSSILYRQHDSNVIGNRIKVSTVSLVLKKLRNPLRKRFYSTMIDEILLGYQDKLEKKEREFLKEVSNYRRSILKKVKLIFDGEIRKHTLRGTIFIKLLILCSKF